MGVAYGCRIWVSNMGELFGASQGHPRSAISDEDQDHQDKDHVDIKSNNHDHRDHEDPWSYNQVH